MKTQKVLLRLREFKPKETKFNDISILLLKPVREDWMEENIEIKEGENIHDRLHELLDNKLRELIQDRRDVFIELEASMPGLAVKVGGGDYTGRIIALSPRPTKLLRIGVVEEREQTGSNSQESDGSGSSVSKGFRLPIDEAKWYDVEEDLYLFEGFVLSKKQWRVIVFVTEHGERVLLPGDFETRTVVLEETVKEKKKSPKSKTKSRRKKRKAKKKRKSRRKKG